MNHAITIGLCSIGSIILILSFLPKKSNYLDIRSILAQHLHVFKGNPLQFVSIFIVPILFSVGILQVKCIDENTINNLNIVLSIMLAMFFSVLGILCTLKTGGKEGNYQRLLSETFTATVFEIVICLLLLIISFITVFIGNFEKTLMLQVTSGVIYYLAIVAILNTLAVIKRIKVLFDNK